MKKMITSIIAVFFILQGCEDVDYKVDPVYEKAEITAVELYNDKVQRADQSSIINSGEGSIVVRLKAGQNITHLKLAVTATTGSSISPAMSAGFQDFTSPKTYRVTSPNKSVVKDWTISVVNP